MADTALLWRKRIVPAGGYLPSEDTIDIILTDAALHAQKPTKPKSLVRNYAKHLKGGKSRRTFGGIKSVADNTFEMSINFDEQEVLDLLAQHGKRMLRIYMPTNYLPVYLAPDALEKIESLKRKHLLQLDSRSN
jgi:hypothetical protein